MHLSQLQSTPETWVSAVCESKVTVVEKKKLKLHNSHVVQLAYRCPNCELQEVCNYPTRGRWALAIKRNYATFPVSRRPPRSSGRSLNPTMKSKSSTLIRSPRNPWTLVETHCRETSSMAFRVYYQHYRI